MKNTLTLLLASLLLPVGAEAALLDALGLGSKHATNDPSVFSSGITGLSQEQMITGLKEALAKGVQNAVAQLGHDGGFLTNASVRIPMPEKMRSVERALRTLKQEQLANDFVATMNHAAEQAVPEAVGIFGAAIQQMSITDASALLTGPTNAATQYFRKVTQTNLFEKFLPIVKTATDKTGVTSAYKQLMRKAGSAGGLGAFGNSLFGGEGADLDAYVTHQAMDALFKMMAAEEMRIRENPAARTSELLQKVFGSVKK